MFVRDFVVSVGTKIDTGTAPVPIRRLPALVGLGGAAAILLVLVVALPRLGPGGPSPSPGPLDAPPSTITAMGVGSFAARLASAELNGQTLLIVGEVVVEGRRGPLCPTSQEDLCYVGNLAGSAIDLHARPVATVAGEGTAIPIGASSWTSWLLPSPPTGIARTMAVSVDSDGVVELLGYTPPEEMALVLSEIQYVDFEAMTLDEVRVVAAWLTGIVAPISCAPPDPGTYIPGLPGRYCGNPSWLAPDPARLDPNGYRIPDDWLEIQSNAYLEFAENPDAANGSAEPRAGAYIIAKRLEGSGCPDARSPCWQWEIIGRLTLVDDGNLAQPLASPEPTTQPGPPTSSPPAASPQPLTPIDCPTAVRVPGDEPTWRMLMHDETGLIESCTWGSPLGRVGDPPIVVSNTDGTSLRLLVEWEDSPCATETHFAFRRHGDGYELIAERNVASCSSPLERRATHLDMKQPLPADLIAASIRDIEPEPLESPEIAPTPTRTPTPTPRTFDCDGLPPSDNHAAVSLQDHSGLVRGCSVPEPGSPTTPLDPHLLTFDWVIPCAADVSDTFLSFWSRQDLETGGSLRQPYVLVVERSPWKPGLGCFTALGRRVVHVEMRQPIARDDIDLTVIKEGHGGELVEFDWGYFTLGLTSDKRQYAAAEPIDIKAELLYEGPPVELWGAGLLSGFAIEQLDGPLAMPPGPMIQPCVSLSLPAGEPYVVPFVKHTHWSDDDPNADFYREWLADPVVRLPAGTWLVTAYSDFLVGPDCRGDPVVMEASVVITVR